MNDERDGSTNLSCSGSCGCVFIRSVDLQQSPERSGHARGYPSFICRNFLLPMAGAQAQRLPLLDARVLCKSGRKAPRQKLHQNSNTETPVADFSCKRIGSESPVDSLERGFYNNVF